MAKSEQAVEKAQLNHKDTKSFVKNPGLLKKVWSAKKNDKIRRMKLNNGLPTTGCGPGN